MIDYMFNKPDFVVKYLYAYSVKIIKFNQTIFQTFAMGL